MIFGFNHAYYVDRSAEQASRFLTPDSVIAAGDRLQTGIDAVPADTRHCVSISSLGSFGDAARWKVTVDEFRPGFEPWVAEQTITTRTLDGVTLISEITAIRISTDWRNEKLSGEIAPRLAAKKAPPIEP